MKGLYGNVKCMITISIPIGANYVSSINILCFYILYCERVCILYSLLTVRVLFFIFYCLVAKALELCVIVIVIDLLSLLALSRGKNF